MGQRGDMYWSKDIVLDDSYLSPFLATKVMGKEGVGFSIPLAWFPPKVVDIFGSLYCFHFVNL